MGRTLHIRDEMMLIVVIIIPHPRHPLTLRHSGGGGGGGWERASGSRDAGNKDENIAAFIAVLIIKSIKYGREEEASKQAAAAKIVSIKEKRAHARTRGRRV